ncbi:MULTISPECIES: hypothetical protein [Roseateles]|uniref:Uncharacterized protein n=1 Tax=Roseateles albus TaxID=2987525 RepID=A0ABT5KGX7_9BURK|nr:MULTISPECIES: hypothetical protein [Roseateles]MCV2357402.1 hypothetical protein [Paucibacter sp. TC2R-5]MDC8772789.1 hypothetical protein [Roseateles albus]
MKKASRTVPWSILLALSLAAQAFAQGYIGLPESEAPPHAVTALAA